jgi:hypothetical protein
VTEWSGNHREAFRRPFCCLHADDHLGRNVAIHRLSGRNVETTNIPAHRRHRVEYTDPDSETVWLALHYS